MFGIPSSFYPDPVFTQIGSEYYAKGANAVSWYSALPNCHRIGAELISISKIEMLYDIQKHRNRTSNGTKYWVDLSDLATKGDYVSISTGWKPTFVHWYS
ncbi:uncharacterized protein Dmoj_GI25797 [Drosophila mojavensis]|uniref:Uncharacterized protein n=1 Tax=Drosophila mojavensis TaxID=7230 RepID=A0A0Q9X509_DROMO|nr:uncharacterized protein Dmoj_GI25797 [Drosophila mojavensis]